MTALQYTNSQPDSDGIVARCKELGFALAGVSAARPSDYPQQLRDWLAAGKHGSMGYLARNTDLRLDPATFVADARTFIMVADLYKERPIAPTESNARPSHSDRAPEQHGKIARYAQGDDYHRVMKRRLHTLCDELRASCPDETFRAFVDTAPVLEREHAARAGLGWVGKHTLLIHPEVGSYFLLGGILTTLKLDPPANQHIITDHCGACTRCIDACPTGAITPYSVSATRCVSYLTIEHRDAIDPALHEGVGDWIFGCDICQDVCPHNSPRSWNDDDPRRCAANAAYTPRNESIDLLKMLNWTEDDRRAAFTRSAMKRATLDMMKRNARIVGKNLGLKLPEESGSIPGPARTTDPPLSS